jgi:hypothetical protein
MKLACPSCHEPVEVQEVDSELSAQVSCGVCGAVIGLTLAVSILSAGDAGLAVPRAGRVVVAMTDSELRGAYAEALSAAGFAVIETGESRQTLQRLGKEVPDVAVIDGGFPPIFGMGISEIVKKSNVTRETRILGLRSEDGSHLPVPGADRTVTITLGTDAIVREVESLAADRRSAVRPNLAHAEPARPPKAPQAAFPAPTPVAPSRPEEARSKEKPAHRAHKPAPAPPAAAKPVPRPAAPAMPGTPDDPEHAAAMRLARIIISDTALYNAEAVEAAIRTGKLRETIEGLLDEGRQHYVERTPNHVRTATDYLGAALDQFVARKMGAMNPTVV